MMSRRGNQRAQSVQPLRQQEPTSQTHSFQTKPSALPVVPRVRRVQHASNAPEDSIHEAANRTQILNSSSGSTLPVLPRNRGWQHAHRTADETLGDLINQTQPVGLFCGMNASTLHGNVAGQGRSGRLGSSSVSSSQKALDNLLQDLSLDFNHAANVTIGAAGPYSTAGRRNHFRPAQPVLLPSGRGSHLGTPILEELVEESNASRRRARSQPLGPSRRPHGFQPLQSIVPSPPSTPVRLHASDRAASCPSVSIERSPPSPNRGIRLKREIEELKQFAIDLPSKRTRRPAGPPVPTLAVQPARPAVRRRKQKGCPPDCTNPMCDHDLTDLEDL